MDGGVYTFFDSGSTNIYISSLFFNNFVAELFAHVNVPWSESEGIIYATCLAEYPNVYFLLNGHWLQIAREDYMRDVSLE